MQIKKNWMGILALTLVFGFTVTGCASREPAPNQPLPYEVGRVTAISNGTIHEPHEHFLHGMIITEGMFLSATGIPLSLEDVSRQLPEIQYTGNFRVVIDGSYASSVGFSLYDDSFNPVYRDMANFISPNEAGVYMLCVDVTWSNDANEQPREFTRIRYIFKLRVS